MGGYACFKLDPDHPGAALVFQDGGVLALGPNIINTAIVGVLTEYAPFRLFLQTHWKWQGVFWGGVCSVLVSGALALGELLLSRIRSRPLCC